MTNCHIRRRWIDWRTTSFIWYERTQEERRNGMTQMMTKWFDSSISTRRRNCEIPHGYSRRRMWRSRLRAERTRKTQHPTSLHEWLDQIEIREKIEGIWQPKWISTIEKTKGTMKWVIWKEKKQKDEKIDIKRDDDLEISTQISLMQSQWEDKWTEWTETNQIIGESHSMRLIQRVREHTILNIWWDIRNLMW